MHRIAVKLLPPLICIAPVACGPTGPPIEVDTAELVGAYISNAPAADARFGGHPLIVTGISGGVDISGVWDMVRQHIKDFAKELYKLMQELNVPLYVATRAQSKDLTDSSDEDDQGYLMVYESVESACRAIRAMAAYHEFRESLI